MVFFKASAFSPTATMPTPTKRAKRMIWSMLALTIAPNGLVGKISMITFMIGGAALAVTFKPSVDMFKPAPGSTNTPKAIPRAIANAVVTK